MLHTQYSSQLWRSSCVRYRYIGIAFADVPVDILRGSSFAHGSGLAETIKVKVWTSNSKKLAELRFSYCVDVGHQVLQLCVPRHLDQL